jgi:transcriptional regulator with XRE-family HTH domain
MRAHRRRRRGAAPRSTEGGAAGELRDHGCVLTLVAYDVKRHLEENVIMADRRERQGPVDWTKTSLGERVEYICKLRDWSMNQLGEAAGLATGVTSRLSRRTSFTAGSPETLARVADAARVNIPWLMLGRGPVERVEHSTAALRNHPDWKVKLAEAKKWQRGIPDEFWELAGDVVFPTPPQLDWQLIVGMVRELFSAHQRWQEEAARRAESGEPESEAPTTESPSGPAESAASASAPAESAEVEKAVPAKSGIRSNWGGARRRGFRAGKR